MGGARPDDDLVTRALQGDRVAFAALCDRSRDRLWRIVRSVARGPDAEDLAQETVVRAYRGLDGYHQNAPFEAWLCRIAVNTAHDYVRSAWRRRVLLFERPPAPESDGGHPRGPEGEIERRELQRRVRQAVARLPEKQRTPIWLHYFEGFSVAEVARLDGLPEATVRSRLRAGLTRLSLSLHDLLPGHESRPPLEADPKGCNA